MKIRTILTGFAIMSLAACNNEIDVPVHSEWEDMHSIKVSLPESRTKVSEKNNPGVPDAVNSLQVFLFDENGKLEDSDMQEASSIVLSCKSGSKKVVALVNAPELSGITSYDQLTATASLLSDNSIDSMVMEGEKEVDITTTTSITVPVSRLAAKVVLRQVINSFQLLTHQSMTFSVTGVYLINIAGEKTYLTDCSPSLWHNKRMLDLDEDPAPDFTYEQLSSPVTIPYSGTWTADKYFYCYPNHTSTDSSDESWSARYTRLVIEATLDGETMYYPISLSEVDQNTAYEISLKITRPGSTSPDIPVSGLAAEFDVDVQDWVTRDLVQEVI